MSAATTTTSKSSGKWKSSLLWIIPLGLVLLAIIATQFAWISLSKGQWTLLIGAILVYGIIVMVATPTKKSAATTSASTTSTSTTTTTAAAAPHHDEPGFYTKLFWRTVAIVGGFIFLTICFPAAWQNLKDWGSSLIRSNTRPSTNRPREYFTETVTVTSAGFSPFRLINEKIDCTVESGDVKIYVSEWDGSNEHVYNANGEDYALSTPHHYKFVAKPGTTAVVSYTITPAKK